MRMERRISVMIILSSLLFKLLLWPFLMILSHNPLQREYILCKFAAKMVRRAHSAPQLFFGFYYLEIIKLLLVLVKREFLNLVVFYWQKTLVEKDTLQKLFQIAPKSLLLQKRRKYEFKQH